MNATAAIVVVAITTAVDLCEGITSTYIISVFLSTVSWFMLA